MRQHHSTPRSALGPPASTVPGVVGALGPTNTGKTHRAIERMLEHDSGMIGLPLRLLAREVYDRVSAEVGEHSVALVTGEEKRVPTHPRYWVCTVEAMPTDRAVDFLAVDEIQMAAHAERGHIFTDRMLHARGRRETWFMGAETILHALSEHVPEVQVRRFPRLSRLTSAGQLTLGALPPKSAVVSFSVEGVYRLAERLRARRGGAAVVLGALSPRARNAQVALFQAGEVDFMVATDAIGMGLNLELAHVSFAEQRKFDGREARPLSTAELAQIAGRAGRYREDGTFSTLVPSPPLPSSTERALERHAFPSEGRLTWRNSALDFSTLDALIQSLSLRPSDPTLSLVQYAEDYQVLRDLVRRDTVRRLATDEASVSLLWEVCQIPDYPRLSLDHHANLVLEVFEQLRRNGGLDADWLRRGILRADNTNGDVDDLVQRMAFIRTWTYITHHRDWVPNSTAWQASARAIEDRLSDALHERLVERFVRVRRQTFGPRGALNGTRKDTGNPFVQMLRERLHSSSAGSKPDWVEQVIDAPHETFRVDLAGRIWTATTHVASWRRGVDILHPEIVVERLADLGAGAASRMTRRLVAWTQDLLHELLRPLRACSADAPPALRGLMYQLEQGLGTLRHTDAEVQLDALGETEHGMLAEQQVCIGARFVYAQTLLDPKLVAVRWALSLAYHGGSQLNFGWDGPTTSVERAREIPHEVYLSVGFPVIAARAIRVDLIERLIRELQQCDTRLPKGRPKEISRWLGCPEPRLPAVLHALGYRPRARAATRGGTTSNRPFRRRRSSAPA